jgi:hypothetical protein
MNKKETISSAPPINLVVQVPPNTYTRQVNSTTKTLVTIIMAGAIG